MYNIWDQDLFPPPPKLLLLSICNVKLMNGAMVAGGCVTIYGISTMVWDVTSLFINLTPASTGVVIFFYNYGIIIQIPTTIQI